MKFAFAVFSLASCASAFWGTGHLIIARQSEALLEKNNPSALSAALNVLASLKSSHPDITNDEDQHPFTECATFADDIKGEGYSWQSPWHFIDQAYYDEGGDVTDYPDFQPDSETVIDALGNLTEFLKGNSTVSSSNYVKQIVNAFSDEDDQKSFALRLIIHYHGDIHQPLHTTSEVDHYYPKGDAGGNFEHIPEVDDTGVTNLHALWDSVIYAFPGYPDLPLSDTDWNNLTSIADDMYTAYPIEQSKLYDGDFNQWAAEGLEASKDYVYKDFDYTHTQSQEYLDKAAPMLKTRMMYGTARLYQTIVDIYGTSADDEMTFKPEAFLQ